MTVVFEGLTTPVWLVVLALSTMAVALSGAVVATVVAVPTWIGYWRRWAEARAHEREVAAAHERGLVDDAIRNDLMVLEHFGPDEDVSPHPVKKPRHNVHCATCGRFAKRVLDIDPNTLSECKVHGVVVRWSSIPTDWALRPVGLHLAIDHTGISDPVTAPIYIEPIEAFVDIDYEVEGAKL